MRDAIRGFVREVAHALPAGIHTAIMVKPCRRVKECVWHARRKAFGGPLPARGPVGLAMMSIVGKASGR